MYIVRWKAPLLLIFFSVWKDQHEETGCIWEGKTWVSAVKEMERNSINWKSTATSYTMFISIFNQTIFTTYTHIHNWHVVPLEKEKDFVEVSLDYASPSMNIDFYPPMSFSFAHVFHHFTNISQTVRTQKLSEESPKRGKSKFSHLKNTIHTV